MVYRKLTTFLKSNGIYLLLGFYALAGFLTIMFFDGTGDNGDSIYHYLFAKYAPVHPELYLNHWAKPLFVLITSPFAQAGFTGMKLFNLLTAILTAWLTYLTACSLEMKKPLLVVVFLLFTPLYYILTFSGLTEPLFAFFLILAVYLAIHEKHLASAVIVSFIPFIRSEGLIIMGMFGFFLLVKKQWKVLPWLAAGHLAFALAGVFVYHDLLWVFTKIPYANLEPRNGSGPLLHFVFQMNYVTGIPLYFLLCMGILSYAVNLAKGRLKFFSAEIILVLSGFIAYFVAHSLFWHLGIFNSMGLKRVLIGVIPLIALVALRGFNFLTGLIPGNKWIGQVTGILLVAYVVIFPFTGNPASVRWDRDMRLTNEQKTARDIAAWVRENPLPPANRYFYTHPYLSEVLNVDHFDSLRRLDLTPWFLDKLKPGDLVIWDNWFAVVESYSPLDSVVKRPGLQPVMNFSTTDNKREVRFVILRQE